MRAVEAGVEPVLLLAYIMRINLNSPAPNKHSTLARLVGSRLRAPRAFDSEEGRGQEEHESKKMGYSH